MSRTARVFVLAWLTSACAQPAYGQYQQLMNESVQLSGQGRYEEAAVTAERALKSAEETLGPEHANVATALNNLAEFQQMAAYVSKDEAAIAKALAAAGTLHERALAIREKALSPRHSFTLASMINLARTYNLQRCRDDAEALYKRAQGILNDIGPRAPVLADLSRQAAAGLGQIDKARSESEASAPAACSRQAVPGKS
jgi:tetratricopeptide (TPR) repeat protein